ncbi:MAG: YpoC family protein [Sporosarcina sp.]
MPSEENRIDKELLAPYFEHWETMRNKIEAFYNQKDQQAVGLMESAIKMYSELLKNGGKVVDDRKGKVVYTLLPLNGEERFEFVKDKISSHYAYIQLDALFTETKKKVARLSIQQK